MDVLGLFEIEVLPVGSKVPAVFLLLLVGFKRLAIEDAKDSSLASCFLEEPLVEKLRPSAMQRLAGYVHERLLGALRLPFRRLNDDRVRALGMELTSGDAMRREDITDDGDT